MAQMTITIPTAALPRVLAGMCGAFGYQATINGAPNPETQAQFAQRMVRQWIKETVRNFEAAQAQAQAAADIEQNITLT